MSEYIDKDKVLEYIIFGVVGKDITCGELKRAIEKLPTIKANVDCISRQDAMEALNRIGSLDTKADREYAKGIFNNISPVTPTERTGEWIGREQCQVDEDAYDVAICSNCKAEITLEYPNDSFCPNCGAKMG